MHSHLTCIQIHRPTLQTAYRQVAIYVLQIVHVLDYGCVTIYFWLDSLTLTIVCWYIFNIFLTQGEFLKKCLSVVRVQKYVQKISGSVKKNMLKCREKNTRQSQLRGKFKCNSYFNLFIYWLLKIYNRCALNLVGHQWVKSTLISMVKFVKKISAYILRIKNLYYM